MNEREKVNQITEGVIWKQLLLFFFPIVFGTFFQQIYNTADTIVVGRFVGKQALAAVGGSASQIANLIVGFFVGLSSGAAVVISQFYGAKDKKNLSKALHTAFAFSIAAGIVLTVVGIFLTRPALLLMKTPADVVEDSAVYLHIYFGGMVFNLVYNMGAAILRAVGDSKRPLYVLIITCVLNIILDLLFVVAFGMGVTGVAVATVTSQVISALIVTVMLLKTREIYVLKINQIRFDRRMLFSVLRIGIPAGLESVMYNISNIVIQVFVNNLGTDTVAAWGTLGKIDALFWMVINAFAISITTFVGQNFGAGKYHRLPHKAPGLQSGPDCPDHKVPEDSLPHLPAPDKLPYFHHHTCRRHLRTALPELYILRLNSGHIRQEHPALHPSTDQKTNYLCRIRRYLLRCPSRVLTLPLIHPRHLRHLLLLL